MNQKDVYDENYRKARKLDSRFFSSNLDLDGTGLLDVIHYGLLKGQKPKGGVRAEIYKLNIYGTWNLILALGAIYLPSMYHYRGRVLFQGP